jgi:hypothetical protein
MKRITLAPARPAKAYGGPWDGQQVTVRADLRQTLDLRVGGHRGHYYRNGGELIWRAIE